MFEFVLPIQRFRQVSIDVINYFFKYIENVINSLNGNNFAKIGEDKVSGILTQNNRHITGNLTVEGLINNVDIRQLFFDIKKLDYLLDNTREPTISNNKFIYMENTNVCTDYITVFGGRNHASLCHYLDGEIYIDLITLITHSADFNRGSIPFAPYRRWGYSLWKFAKRWLRRH